MARVTIQARDLQAGDQVDAGDEGRYTVYAPVQPADHTFDHVPEDERPDCAGWVIAKIRWADGFTGTRMWPGDQEIEVEREEVER